jgi:hypothetical protein
MSEQVNGAEVRDARVVDSTAVVDQAAGMLSVQLEVPVAVALVWLRCFAFIHGQFVAEVAADVVALRLSFDVGDR